MILGACHLKLINESVLNNFVSYNMTHETLLFCLGIISATDIHLNGEILNIGTAQKVKLKCYSCREPRHNYAEFLINGTSTDGISYNKTIDKCSNQYGECNLHVCSCHRSGNEFINIFNVTNVFGTYYSCEMRFNDNDKKSIFSIERTVYVNNTGTVFTYIERVFMMLRLL